MSDVAADQPAHHVPDDDALPDRLCHAIVAVLDVDGAAISVYLGGDIAVPVGANSLEAAVGEALQFTLREGPCIEAFTTGRPVLHGDLEPGSPAGARCPVYAAQLMQHTGYNAVFAYPLTAGGATIGSLSLYRRSGGQPDYLSDMGMITGRVAEQLLAAETFEGPDGEPVHPWMEGPGSRRRRMVWQAQGLTLQANGLTPGQAIDLLRARAFADDRMLDDVAGDVVAGRIPIPMLDEDD